MIALFLARLGCVLDIDSGCYIALAEGRYDAVVRPFSNRVLGPLLAQFIGFGAVQVLAGVLFALAIVWLLRRCGVSIWKALPFLFAPWVVSFGYNLYMPDLLVCALTALLFGVYASYGLFAALPVLVLMMVARESTIVVAGVWVCLTLWEVWKGRLARRHGLFAIGGIALAVMLGTAIVRLVSADSPGDINGLGALYMPIKALVMGLSSATGVIPWNDVYARELPQFYTHAPIWKMTCPAWLRLGCFAEIGIYEYRPFQLFVTLKIMLLEFGILAPYALFRRRALLAACASAWLRLAFWSGIVYWIFTPLCGFSPLRYIGYAWPLFWFAPVMLLQNEPPRRRLALLAAHFALLLLARLV